MKQCFKCLLVLPLDAFYKHAQMADGHLNKCVVCTKKDVLEHRQANLERVRAYDRQRASKPHRVAQAKEIQKRWRGMFPNRRRAQVLAGNAIRRGALVAWPVCAVPECQHKPEAHHPNYDAPLDVVWLCPSHHHQAHAIKPF